MKKIKNLFYFRAYLILTIAFVLNQTPGTFAADQITQLDGYVAVYNACKEPAALWTTWSSDNNIPDVRQKPRKYHRLDIVQPGKQFDFGGNTPLAVEWPVWSSQQQAIQLLKFNPNLNSWNGIGGLRIIAKLGCDIYGTNCNIGESLLSMPIIDDDAYDHFFYSPAGLYTQTLPNQAKSLFDMIKTGDQSTPAKKTNLASMLREAVYGKTSVFPQPSIESGFEGSFKCKNIPKDSSGNPIPDPNYPSGASEDQKCQTTASQLPLASGNYYDVSFVDGFTLPVFVKVFQATDVGDDLPNQENASSCRDIDASNHLPLSELIKTYISSEIASRGNRMAFDTVCSMDGVKLNEDFFYEQPEYNFESLSPAIINANTGKIIGCAAPKARLLAREKEEGAWTHKDVTGADTTYLSNLFNSDQPSSNSQEYDSRVIQFACPYGQGDLKAFQETDDGTFKCASGSGLCVKSDSASESFYLSPFDEKASRIHANLPFATLIGKLLPYPAFRANDPSGQGANNMCHGPRDDPSVYSTFPIENTAWVKNLRSQTTNVYTYTYDDASGLSRCNSSKSSFVVVLCGDETFVNANLVNPLPPPHYP